MELLVILTAWTESIYKLYKGTARITCLFFSATTFCIV